MRDWCEHFIHAFSNKQIIGEILAHRPPPIPEHVPAGFRSLLKSCWSAPDQRPSFYEIVQQISADAFLTDDEMQKAVPHGRCMRCRKAAGYGAKKYLPASATEVEPQQVKCTNCCE